MWSRSLLLAFAVWALASGANGQRTTQAIVHLQGAAVSGSVTFTEHTDGVLVAGAITGLTPGAYGFHVHELGDTSDSCLASGAHFNPASVTHGGPDHDVRHVGDLGNVVFGADGVARVNFVDRLLALDGTNGIVGRALVLHEREDDLGLGQHADSLTTGNAGARVACGVIGIAVSSDAAVSGPWAYVLVTLCALSQLLRLH